MEIASIICIDKPSPRMSIAALSMFGLVKAYFKNKKCYSNRPPEKEKFYISI